MNLRKEIKKKLIEIIGDHLKNSSADEFPLERITLDYTPNLNMGHYASNAAMLLTKLLKKKPTLIGEELKEKILARSDLSQLIRKVEIAGAGFLNFFLKPEAFSAFFKEKFILENWIKHSFLEEEEEEKEAQPKIHFEFVSANPTGPLNIVSARAAAVGDSICRVLERAGKNVFREYYVNDFGNQVYLLGVSFAVRYLQSRGLAVEIPENGYQGEYIKEILASLLEQEDIPSFISETGHLSLDKKEELEAWLTKAADFFSPLAVEFLLTSHKKDLQDFRVGFDHFFSEKSLHEQDKVEAVFRLLEEKGYVYQDEGASFFKSTEFGDDKDRVLKKKDGTSTYFLSDIAYHVEKFSRGYSLVYDIWGPDHHGYISRLKGAVKACGCVPDNSSKGFEVLIAQQVNLMEEGRPILMSKRLGQFQSMRDLIEKIPVDVSRYFFVSRSQSQHLDFDLELALDQSQKNPVYYIQYAHARIHSILRSVSEAGGSEDNPSTLESLQIFPEKSVSVHLDEWIFKADREYLLFQLIKFPDELDMICKNLEVHRLSTHLYELANHFTKFYHNKNNQILPLFKKYAPDTDEFKEALFLLRICQNTAEVLSEGLSLLGIQAPKSM